MSIGEVGRITDAMRHERYRFRPVRRDYIPKKDGGKAAARTAGVVGQLGGEVKGLCWRRASRRSCPMALTVTVPAEDATRRCPRWPTPELGPAGLSKAISPSA